MNSRNENQGHDPQQFVDSSKILFLCFIGMLVFVGITVCVGILIDLAQ